MVERVTSTNNSIPLQSRLFYLWAARCTKTTFILRTNLFVYPICLAAAPIGNLNKANT
jgi:hypothetical protein